MPIHPAFACFGLVFFLINMDVNSPNTVRFCIFQVKIRAITQSTYRVSHMK